MNGRMLGSVLAIVGAIVVLVSMFLPWYTTTYSGSDTIQGIHFSVSENVNFLPGSSYTITSSCSGNSQACNFASAVTGTFSYSGHNQSSTGNLYVAVQGLLIGGFVLGLLGAILGFLATGSRSRWMMPAILLVLLGLVLALAAGAYMAADNTAAVKSDFGSSASSESGPWNSFIGSCSASGSSSTCFTGGFSNGNASASWGPAVGFYVVWVGVVLLLVALLMLWMARRSQASAEASAPAPEAAPSTEAAPPMMSEQGGTGPSP